MQPAPQIDNVYSLDQSPAPQSFPRRNITTRLRSQQVIKPQLKFEAIMALQQAASSGVYNQADFSKDQKLQEKLAYLKNHNKILMQLGHKNQPIPTIN